MNNICIKALLLCLIIGTLATNVSASAVTDISIKGIEVTQAVQCFGDSCADNSIPISFGKTSTVVRVYIGHEGGNLCPSGKPYEPVLNNVKVTLNWFTWKKGQPVPPGTIYFTDSRSFNIPCSNDISQLRQDLYKGTALFIIKQDEIGVPIAQDQELLLEADVSSSITESNNNNNKMETKIPIFPVNPLNVQYAWIDYKPQKSTTGLGQYNGPEFADSLSANLGDRLVQKTYPMEVNYAPSKAPILYEGPDLRDACSLSRDCISNSILQTLSDAYKLTSPKPDALVGWLPKGTTNPLGGVAKGLTILGGNVIWVIDDNDFYVTTSLVAHEVGHTQGLEHTEGPIGVTGVDIKEDSIVAPTVDNFMEEVVEHNNWILPSHWNALMKVKSGVASGTQPSLGPSLGGLSTVSLPVLNSAFLVSGKIENNNNIESGEIDPLFRIDIESFSESNTNGAYCIDLKNQDTILNTFCFDLSKLENGNTYSEFSFLLPYLQNADNIILRHGSNVLAQRSKSPNIPKLTITSPVQNDMVNDVAKISYTSSDSDNDNLQYIVLYSPDSSSWNPIAIRTENKEIDVNGNMLAGSNNAAIRVLVSDGFNTQVADSAVFQVANKPPFVYIEFPKDNAIVQQIGNIVFAGEAKDIEDGELKTDDISWESDRDGLLGKGKEIIVDSTKLSIGKHIIKLTAKDSNGQTASSSVTIFVVPTGSISGIKFEDLNANGQKDLQEQGLSNWSIILTNETGFALTNVTDDNGSYTFSELPNGNYTIEEVLKSGWVQTVPLPNIYKVTIENGEDIKDQNFGNFHKGNITGGGWITDSTKDTFGLVGQYVDNVPQGNVEYQDRTNNRNIKSIEIKTVATTLDKKKGVITGIASVNGTGSYPFEVYVEDNAEPGKGKDVISISIPDLSYQKGNVLGSGNIQIHE